MNKITCKLCGICCHLVDKDGNQTNKPCKYLVRLKSGKTLCRVFKTRLGRYIGEVDGNKNYCILRKDSKLDYEGCPYNKK